MRHAEPLSVFLQISFLIVLVTAKKRASLLRSFFWCAGVMMCFAKDALRLQSCWCPGFCGDGKGYFSLTKA